MENSTMGVLRPVAHAALIALFTLGGAGTLAAQTAALVPNAKQIFVNANGAPLAGGSVTSYVPNTTVPKTTWLDENEVTPNANPVTLDASGGAFIFGQGNYRQIVKDANGNLIWDGFTSAYGSSSPAGATGSDTAPVGTILPWAGFNFNVPTNWALAYGQALSRTTYPQLLAAITISTTTGNCTASSATISGFSDTSQLAVGSPIEASCLPTGDTVASIVNGTTITVAVAATATGTFTVTAFPWGNGDGVSTFNVPDLRGRVLPGADAMGGSAAGRLTSAYYGTSAATPAIAGGNQYESSSFTLAQNQLPNIAPAFSGSSGSVSVTSTVGGIIHDATIVGGIGTGAANYDAFDPGASASTVTSIGSFTPSGTVASINGNVTQQSVPYSLTTIQPSITMDWIIKIAPNTTGAGGVTSANGLFGDVLWLAGTGMSVNTTSPNITYSCIPALSSVIGCVQPDGVTTTVNASGVLTAIGAATTSIDAGGATSISNGLAGDLLYDNAGKVGHETLLPLANGGLGASQSAATANQIPVFPGSGGGAVPTLAATAVNNSCPTTTAQCVALFGYANPVWWGADPTGSSDSTSAINSAITAASGGQVRFPAGTFKVTAQISISTANTQLIGSGRLSTIIKTTQTAENVFNVAASYVRIAYMAIVGTPGQVATLGAAISSSGNFVGGSYDNLYISDLYEGIALSNVSGWKISFVKLLDIYGPAGLIMSGGGGNYFRDNQFDPLFYSTTQYSTTSGYSAWVSNHAYSAGNVAIVNGGIFVCQTAGTSASSGSGPVITAFNTLITDGTVQWYFLGASNSAGISITSTSNSNFIRHSDISGPWTVGIQINSSDGNIIDGVTIGQTIGIGVQLQANATNTDITNSIFDGMLYTTGLGVSDNNGSSNGTRVVSNQFNGAGWYCILVQGALDWVIADNTITGCGNITGAPAIGLISATTKANVHDNVVISSSGMTSGITVGAAASDYLSIHDNNLQTVSLSYSGTGTHNVIKGNIGYNPVGLTAGTSTGTSASTITAGPSPETHYITQSATFNAAVKSGATTLCTVATATVPCVIELGPNESYSVTWTTTQPTYSKYVH